jgi:chemotaxis protein methyltransferase CheR
MSTLAARRPDEYVAFCQGIRRLTGIDLLQYKRGQMERRIRSFARRHRIEELPEYLAALGRDRALLDELLDRVTINVSQLWRNPEQWERLRRDVIPELAAAGRIHAWSAGC